MPKTNKKGFTALFPLILIAGILLAAVYIIRTNIDIIKANPIPTYQPTANPASNDNKLKNICNENNGLFDQQYNECAGITKAVCEQNGGTFNDCASPCRHDANAQVCNMMCVEVCEFN